VKSHKASKHPPARVVTMIAMVAIIVAALFSLMLGDWIIGAIIGAVFAAGFYFVVIFQARRAPKKRRRR
jgi:uncharacterized membrane protein YjjP (DUF1212 family)